MPSCAVPAAAPESGPAKGTLVIIPTNNGNKGADVMMTEEPNHQHINTRNRWDDLIPVIKKYPQYLGIGRWKVTVHDNTHARRRGPYREASRMAVRHAEQKASGLRSMSST